ncbi:MAG: hypothetical protein U0R27_10055 [Candidatus Nanopelagicales bacterium]
MADSVWWPLVDGVLADNPDLQATTRSVLSLLIEVDAELDKRGAPYPQTLAYLVALCALHDESLREAQPRTGDRSVEALMCAFAGTGTADWSTLGSSAAGWLSEIV